MARKIDSRFALGSLVVLAGVTVMWSVVFVMGDPVKSIVYEPRVPIETSGYLATYDHLEPWDYVDSLEEYSALHKNHIPHCLEILEEMLATGTQPMEKVLMSKASLLHSQGDPRGAYQTLCDFENRVRGTELESKILYTIIFYKGLSGMRIGENENCIMCRGESSCIFPISPAAVHTNPAGSRLAIEHFTEYLRAFPDDLEVKWLLNLAHMTLGEHPNKVDPNHRLQFDEFTRSEFDVGRFRDVGHKVGLNGRLNQSGGAILEDFDNDGLLDIVVTDWDPSGPMAYFRNMGDGSFEDRTKAAGLEKQTSGLYCVQTDYNNDGYMDIFIPRGAWLAPHLAMRPSLLRNNGNGTFSDVTKEAGLTAPMNSNTVSWGDFDNDGFLDLFVCGHHRPVSLYRNLGNGTFANVTVSAGLSDMNATLGAAWIDYDNDGYSDLFINIGRGIGGPPEGTARLYHNNRNGTFEDVTAAMGIKGPTNGFACWAFDFDNDGWIDIFAATTIHTLEDVLKGMLNQPFTSETPRLYRNLQGKGFQDVTAEAGLNKVYSPMGCNFGDIDNDGYLDFYLATGDPCLSTLIPNRLFKNVEGKRFADITASSRTGHLQKGHGVSFGDWDRNGTLDLFVQLGGAIKGDQYHDVLFQNPGQGNNWLSVKLIGAKSNRPAIGARIKVITAGEKPLTVQRHVSSGSSFGANSLEQHIGLGKANGIATLEVFWPASGTRQIFTDVPINQGIIVTEFAKDYQKRTWKPIAVPE